jgi:hypothetical protein
VVLTESFGGGHDGGVDRPERQIAIGPGQFGDPDPVGRQDGFGKEVPGCQVPEEPDLGLDSQPSAEEVNDLGDHEYGNDQGSGMLLEELETFGVMPVVPIDVGIERAGIDHEGYEATSARRIRSICSDTSD